MKKAFIAVFLLAMLAPPCAAWAGNTVGVILTRGNPLYEDSYNALAKYVSGPSHGGIRFLLLRPYPDPISWSNSARKLIAVDVNAIVTFGASATFAALRENPGVPVIYAGLTRTTAAMIKGKNAAGVYSSLPLASVIRYLKDIRATRTLGILYDSREADSAYDTAEIARVAKEYGMNPVRLNLVKSGEVASLLAGAKIDSLYVTECATAGSAYQSVLGEMWRRKIPVASLISNPQQPAQALITLSPDPQEQGQMAGQLLLQALERSSARGLGPLESRRFSLIYNYRQSVVLGLRISLGLVTEATRVIY
ncbi:MAG: ABC transporter substrate binding protein [Nitrospiraceae bacterium]|nr:ABC transporter substrate binding protein [Nitrospiraceae bacterium]